jgi:hypothetical protein
MPVTVHITWTRGAVKRAEQEWVFTELTEAVVQDLRNSLANAEWGYPEDTVFAPTPDNYTVRFAGRRGDQGPRRRLPSSSRTATTP